MRHKLHEQLIILQTFSVSVNFMIHSDSKKLPQLDRHGFFTVSDFD